MALNLGDDKGIFLTAKEKNEGITSKGQFAGSQLLFGYSTYILNNSEIKDVPIMGTDNSGEGGAYRIASDCEISKIKAGVGTNTFTTAQTTFTMFISDKDGNPLTSDVFFLFTAGTTGIKEASFKTYYVPQGGTIQLKLASSAGGAGTATDFSFSGNMDILK